MTTSILLIDDDEDDFLIVKSLLAKVPGRSFRLDWESDSTVAKERIRSDNHDAYLVDYRLGADTGLNLLADLDIPDRRQPFIILTGAGDRDVEQRAMRMGVADYLVKGSFDAELLSRVLRYSLQRKAMEMQRIQHLMEVNKSKDEFISLASHQLRTPATVVKQYIAMVLDGYTGDVSADQRAMLLKAYDGNELQLRIVNDLLHVAALDAGRVHLQRTSVNLVSLVKECVQDQRAKMAERNQHTVLGSPKAPARLQADELKLRMVLDNLLDNASKYSDHGSVIDVDVVETAKALRVSIRDYGVGIKPADLSKLFQKFTRIPNRLSAEVGGSGLGLYWAHKIIDLHGGTLEVDSTEGEGTTFTIVLPRPAKPD